MAGTKNNIIEKRFVHFKHYSTFLTQINNELDYVEGKLLYGNLKYNSIVWVSDEGLIWTHGKFYPIFKLKGINDLQLPDDLTLDEWDSITMAFGKLQKRINNNSESITDIYNEIQTLIDNLNASINTGESKYFTTIVQTDGKLDDTKVIVKNISEALLNNYLKSTEITGNVNSTDSINKAFNKIENNIDSVITSLGDYYTKTEIDNKSFVNSVEVTGSGNAVTNISKNGNKITATKGTTFLTTHQDLSHLLRIDGTNGTANGVSTLINKLEIGNSTPSDSDYYISLYAGGGSTYTTYHRRPMSALWKYIKGKGDSIWQPIGNYLTSHLSIYSLTILKNGTTIDTYTPNNSTKTINISDVASAATLSSHIGNTTIHITSAERTKWDNTTTLLNSIMGSDSDNVVNKWNEIVAFLDTYTEADTLANLLSNKADKSQLNNYYTKTESDSKYLTSHQSLANYYTKSEVDAKNWLSVIDAMYNVDPDRTWENIRTDMRVRFFDVYRNAGIGSYGNVMEISGRSKHWQPQLWFDGGSNNNIYYRNTDYNGDKPVYGNWRTLLFDTNYSTYTDTRYYTKGESDERYARLAAPNNLTHSTNEVTMVPSGYNDALWFNYGTCGGLNGNISRYVFGNGAGQRTAIEAFSFIKSDGTASQFLKADGSVDSNTYLTSASSLAWSKLTGKPTTLSGYGITDAYTKSDSDSRFVNASGDTMTGMLTINANENNLILNSNSSNSWIYFKSNSVNKSSVGYYSGLGYVANEATYARIGITDSGNPEYWVDSVGTKRYTLWHSGNDGSGSGLDADLLDGVHNGDLTAKKLQTARSIWGQSFDGTADIPISFSATMPYVYFKNYNDDGLAGYVGRGRSSSNEIMLGAYSGNEITLSANDGRRDLVISTAHNVGIGLGDTSPVYKLDVGGDIRGYWLRSIGDTGWYNETYGGGWQMTDSVWIREYGGKSLYMGNGEIQTLNNFNRRGSHNYSWNEGVGAYNVALPNNRSQTPLLLAYNSAVEATNATGANRFFAMELLNDGTQLRYNFLGNHRFTMLQDGVFYAAGGITTDGSIGIGTTSPSYKLHVIGTTKTTALAVDSSELVTNLNSDMLDGYHAAFFATKTELELLKLRINQLEEKLEEIVNPDITVVEGVDTTYILFSDTSLSKTITITSLKNPPVINVTNRLGSVSVGTITKQSDYKYTCTISAQNWVKNDDPEYNQAYNLPYGYHILSDLTVTLLNKTITINVKGFYADDSAPVV